MPGSVAVSAAVADTVQHSRRHLLGAAASLLLPAWARAAAPVFPPVLAGRKLEFPRDYGAHPAYRTEWWYITGWLETGQAAQTRQLGFQVTFFRSRTTHAPDNPSHFAPTQLVIAHAALSDPALGHLLHDQKSAREGFGLAWAKEGDTDVKLDQWSLKRTPSGVYAARLAARDFSLDLDFKPTQPLLLQGEQGYSRKGPLPAQASYYYSEPQLQVRGQVQENGRALPVQGRAWLDHEWSSTVLDERASGWDWVGANLDDGSALMMFRIRTGNGESLWAHATLRDAQGRVTHFGPQEVRFKPARLWRSPRTGASYPVAGSFFTGDSEWQLTPLQDDQELDSRSSTGSVYWEGAVSVARDGKEAGHGYLELTGYQKALKL